MIKMMILIVRINLRLLHIITQLKLTLKKSQHRKQVVFIMHDKFYVNKPVNFILYLKYIKL
jgi:hypothetical protein